MTICNVRTKLFGYNLGACSIDIYSSRQPLRALFSGKRLATRLGPKRLSKNQAEGLSSFFKACFESTISLFLESQVFAPRYKKSL